MLVGSRGECMCGAGVSIGAFGDPSAARDFFVIFWVNIS